MKSSMRVVFPVMLPPQSRRKIVYIVKKFPGYPYKEGLIEFRVAEPCAAEHLHLVSFRKSIHDDGSLPLVQETEPVVSVEAVNMENRL